MIKNKFFQCILFCLIFISNNVFATDFVLKANDTDTSNFSKSSGAWFKHDHSNLGIYYDFLTTFSETTSTQYATWKTSSFPSDDYGSYQVSVRIPFLAYSYDPDGSSNYMNNYLATENANYTIYDGNTVIANIKISQKVDTTKWVGLGNYVFINQPKIVLSDKTTSQEKSAKKSIIFSAIKLVKTGNLIAGSCGGANGYTFKYNDTYYTDTYNQCDAGDTSSTTFPAQGGNWSWVCKGSNGGSNETCSTSRDSAPIAINGQCGDADGYAFKYNDTGYSTTYNQCDVGVSDSVDFPNKGDSTSWKCLGENNGTDANCSASRDQQPTIINGACGAAAKTYTFDAVDFSGSYCSSGSVNATPSFPSKGSSVGWVCNGSNTGSNASCTADRETKPVEKTNGECGTAAKTYLFDTEAFSGSFCSAGTVNDTPIFPNEGTSVDWACNGINDGTNASCIASRESEIVEKVNGVCGSAAKAYIFGSTEYDGDYCSAGTIDSTPNFPSAGESKSWICNGANEGTNKSCSASQSAENAGEPPVLALVSHGVTENKYSGIDFGNSKSGFSLPLNSPAVIRFDVQDVDNDIAIIQINCDGSESPPIDVPVTSTGEVNVTCTFKRSNYNDESISEEYWARHVSWSAIAIDSKGNKSNQLDRANFVIYDYLAYQTEIDKLNADIQSEEQTQVGLNNTKENLTGDLNVDITQFNNLVEQNLPSAEDERVRLIKTDCPWLNNDGTCGELLVADVYKKAIAYKNGDDKNIIVSTYNYATYPYTTYISYFPHHNSTKYVDDKIQLYPAFVWIEYHKDPISVLHDNNNPSTTPRVLVNNAKHLKDQIEALKFIVTSDIDNNTITISDVLIGDYKKLNISFNAEGLITLGYPEYSLHRKYIDLALQETKDELQLSDEEEKFVLSLIFDAMPFIGTAKSIWQTGTGEELFTSLEVNRWTEGGMVLVSFVPAGKLAAKGINKSAKLTKLYDKAKVVLPIFSKKLNAIKTAGIRGLIKRLPPLKTETITGIDVTVKNNLKKKLISDHALKLPFDDKIKSDLVNKIKKGDPKGFLTEDLTDIFFTENLYSGFKSYSKHGKYSGDKGIDGIFIYTSLANPEKILIIESKQMSKYGTISLGKENLDTGLPPQMTVEWIEQTAKKLANKDLGDVLLNKINDIERYVTAVNKKTGEFTIIKLSDN
jgi:hypothetical protein